MRARAIAAVVIPVLAFPLFEASAAPPGHVRDFDGDGFDDLVIAAKRESIGGATFAGAVHVLYGSANRISTQGDDFWHQDKSDIADRPEDFDEFGSALTIGDFNGDNKSDLAIGVPGENGGDHGRGVVHVLYSAGGGLRASGSDLFRQTGTENEDDDHFGHALAAADFDFDGFDDLAIGIMFEDIGAMGDAGAVVVLYGSPQGLSTETSQRWTRESLGQSSQNNENFGISLATGDLNGDGFMDLCIGSRSRELDGGSESGTVQVLYSDEIGLSSEGTQMWHPGVAGVRGDGFFMSRHLVCGDFNGDNFDDLAVDAFHNDQGVNILYGSAQVGLTADGDQLFAYPDPFFGSQGLQLASGDFDGDGNFDLVVGVFLATVDDELAAGEVFVIPGSETGLNRANELDWDQQGRLPGRPEESDRLGEALAVGDFNGDNLDDLAIGVNGQAVNGHVETGLVHVLYGHSSIGLDTDGDQVFHQNSNGVADSCEANERFGAVLGN